MTRTLLRTLLLTAALAALGAHAAAQSAPPQDEALRRELLSMYEADQAARQGGAEALRDEKLRCEMEKVDAAHTKRMGEILDAHGFPGVPLVGREAAQAAHTMIVHSPSLKLKQQALPLVEQAARRGEVPMSAYAVLLDTVLRHEGQPQVYGTKFDLVGDKLVIAPTRDVKSLAARRARVGLQPLGEYMKGLEEMYKVPVLAAGVPR